MVPEPKKPTSSRRSEALSTAWIIVSSLVWAAVIIDTGEIGWPLAVWMATTFAPLSVLSACERDKALNSDPTQ